jgi:hypothetical protein
MNDGQLTTHAEPDLAPFRVHLMVRAGRILRARHGPSPHHGHWGHGGYGFGGIVVTGNSCWRWSPRLQQRVYVCY